MELKEFDGLIVSIKDVDDVTYEGKCFFNDAEYSYAEYGRNEDALQIVNFLFYKSDIKDIMIIDDKDFLNKYGNIELFNLEDGIDSTKDSLFSEEECDVVRILNCLKDNYKELKTDYLNELVKLLENLLSYSDNELIINKTNKLIDLIKN